MHVLESLQYDMQLDNESFVTTNRMDADKAKRPSKQALPSRLYDECPCFSYDRTSQPNGSRALN